MTSAPAAGAWSTLRARGFRWRVRAAARRELEGALFSRLPELPAPVPVARLRRGRSFHALDSEGGGLFVKRLAPRGYGPTLLYRVLARRMRGRREFEKARRVFARGAAVPEPLAFGERHVLFRSYESLLVYRRLPPRARALDQLGLGAAPRRVRARLAETLARFTAALHERGVFHMDLTPPNVVLDGDPAGAFRLYAVDLETTLVGPPGDARLSVRSLGKMAEKFRGARPAERLRFLDAYCAARAAPPAERRRLWRAVRADRAERAGAAKGARPEPR